VHDDALRVVEGFRQVVQTRFLEHAHLLFLGQGLSAFLLLDSLLGPNLNFSKVLSFIVLLVGLEEFHSLDFGCDISLQVVALALLPAISVALDRAQGEQPLLLVVPAILTHSVEAADKLHLLGDVRLNLEDFPLFIIGLERLTIGLSLFLALLLSLLESLALLSLGTLLLVDLDLVSNTGIESLFEEAGLVLEADRHVGAELGHLEEMDLALSDNLRHDHELGEHFLNWLFRDGDRVALFIELGLNGRFLLHGLIFKELVSDTTAWLEHLVDNKAVVGVRIAEVDVRGGLAVDVCLVVILVGDGLLGLHHLADVNGGRTGAYLQVVVKVLQLVGQIRRIVDQIVEGLNLVGPLLGFLLTGFDSLVLLGALLVVL